MYCRNCGTLNKHDVNFCYQCGKKMKVNITQNKKPLNKLKNESFNTINKFNYLIDSKSKNKYQKIFILTSIITVSFVIFMYVSLTTPNALFIAIDSITKGKTSIKVSHFLWRDIWFRLLFMFTSAFAFCDSLFMLINTAVKSQKPKSKKK